MNTWLGLAARAEPHLEPTARGAPPRGAGGHVVLRDDRAAVSCQQPDVQLVDTHVQPAVLVPGGGVQAFGCHCSSRVPTSTPGPKHHTRHTGGLPLCAPGLASPNPPRSPRGSHRVWPSGMLRAGLGGCPGHWCILHLTQLGGGQGRLPGGATWSRIPKDKEEFVSRTEGDQASENEGTVSSLARLRDWKSQREGARKLGRAGSCSGMRVLVTSSHQGRTGEPCA